MKTEQLLTRILGLAMKNKLKLECYKTEAGLDLGLIVTELLKHKLISEDTYAQFNNKIIS